MAVEINDSFMIPVSSGNAVSSGWTSATERRPMGVTWHWTATWDLQGCRNAIGGSDPSRKGVASAHYAIGRSFSEGIDRYVSMRNRSWHAGKNQLLRWDGKPSTNQTKGARATIGIETVNVGYARAGIAAQSDWINAASPNGKQEMRVQPWPEEQIQMMIQVGREIVAQWPTITWTDHHGHHDACPGYKVDVAGFPFARVLRGIYEDTDIPDIWTPFWTAEQRQRALVLLGYDLGDFGPTNDGVDGDWGRASDAALSDFQKRHGLVENGYWTTYVSRAVWYALREQGIAATQTGSAG